MARPKKEVPWLELRGGVYYAYRYEAATRTTRRLSLRTRDPGEAQDRFASFIRLGVFTEDARGDVLTVSQALDDYWREHASTRCADPVRQENAIRHLKAHFGDAVLADVDIPATRRYAEARRAGVIGGGRRRANKAGSDSTIRRELAVLSAAARHAVRWKRLSAAPPIDRPPERRLGPDDEAPYFTVEEIDLLMGAADGELRWFIELAYLTGARKASIQELTWSQVKAAERRILLQPPGKKATKKRQPIVPILDDMKPALDALAVMKRPNTDRVFSTADFYRPFRELCVSMGMGDRSHPHLLRHSRATHLLQKGVSLYSVARLLGDTVATVERVYGHHSAQHLERELGGR